MARRRGPQTPGVIQDGCRAVFVEMRFQRCAAGRGGRSRCAGRGCRDSVRSWLAGPARSGTGPSRRGCRNAGGSPADRRERVGTRPPRLLRTSWGRAWRRGSRARLERLNERGRFDHDPRQHCEDPPVQSLPMRRFEVKGSAGQPGPADQRLVAREERRRRLDPDAAIGECDTTEHDVPLVVAVGGADLAEMPLAVRSQREREGPPSPGTSRRSRGRWWPRNRKAEPAADCSRSRRDRRSATSRRSFFCLARSAASGAASSPQIWLETARISSGRRLAASASKSHRVA